jgi:hypothetical protein
MATTITPRREFRSWTDQATGTRLSGRFAGLRAGQFGSLCDVDTPDGPVTVPAGTVLAGRLAEVAVGTNIVITHLGMRPSGKHPGREYRDFEVEIAERRPERSEPEPKAEDVPF